MHLRLDLLVIVCLLLGCSSGAKRKEKYSQAEVIRELLSDTSTELTTVTYDTFEQEHDLFLVLHYHPDHALSYHMAVLFQKEAKKYTESELVKKALKEIYENKAKAESKNPNELSDFLGDENVDGLKTWAGSSSTSLYYRSADGKRRTPICAFGFVDAQAQPILSRRMNVERLPALQLVRKGSRFVSTIENMREEEITFLVERSAKGIVSVIANMYQWQAFIKSKPVSVLAILKDLNSREYDIFERAVQDYSFHYQIHFGVTTEAEIVHHYGIEWKESTGSIGNSYRDINGAMGPQSGPQPDVMGTNDVVLMIHAGPHSKPQYFQGNYTTASINLWIQKWGEVAVPEVNGENWAKWAMSPKPMFLLIEEYKDVSEIENLIDILYQLNAEFSDHLYFAYANLAQTPHVIDFYRFSGEVTPVITISHHSTNKHFNYPENGSITMGALREWILRWLDGGVEGRDIELPDNVKNTYDSKPKLILKKVQ